MSKTSTKRAATEATENPDVAIVRRATAPKLSPRGEGGIDYEVGRVGGDVYVRIEKNHGGGSCSKEWVPFPVMGCGFDSRLAHHFISPGRMKVWRSYRGNARLFASRRVKEVMLAHSTEVQVHRDGVLHGARFTARNLSRRTGRCFTCFASCFLLAP